MPRYIIIFYAPCIRSISGIRVPMRYLTFRSEPTRGLREPDYTLVAYIIIQRWWAICRVTHYYSTRPWVATLHQQMSYLTKMLNIWWSTTIYLGVLFILLHDMEHNNKLCDK